MSAILWILFDKSMTIDDFKEDRDNRLIEYFENMNLYDLERLKKCFESAYKYELENRDCLDNIFQCLDKVISMKKG